MSVLVQIEWIFGVSLLSEGVSAILPFTFPGSVLAMLLLLILFLTNVVKPAQLKETSGFFMDHMAMFFVPVCVSVMQYADVLFQNVGAIVLISLLTTPLVFFVTGHAVQVTMKLLKRRGEKK